MLKPESEWRQGMTWDKLVEEMDRALRIPGVANAWTMPIKNRIDMLSTGIRTPVGVKIFGSDLKRSKRSANNWKGFCSPSPVREPFSPSELQAVIIWISTFAATP